MLLRLLCLIMVVPLSGCSGLIAFSGVRLNTLETRDEVRISLVKSYDTSIKKRARPFFLP